MSPWRGSGPQSAGTGALLKEFLLLWMIASGAGSLLLYLILVLLLSWPFAGGYGSVFFGLRHQLDTLLPVVGLSALAHLLLVGGIAALLCIRLLHRIAGPIFKLERVLGSYLDGDPVKPLFFRHGDLVPGLARAFNGFASRLREDRRKCLREMENALAALESLLSGYR